GLYGATTGPWTTDMFVEAAYREIKANTPAWKARLLRNVPGDEIPLIGGKGAPPAAARKSATAAKAGKKGSGDPLEGKWVLNLFVSSYDPSNLMPYRREMVVTVNGYEAKYEVSSWRRAQGN